MIKDENIIESKIIFGILCFNMKNITLNFVIMATYGILKIKIMLQKNLTTEENQK